MRLNIMVLVLSVVLVAIQPFSYSQCTINSSISGDISTPISVNFSASGVPVSSVASMKWVLTQDGRSEEFIWSSGSKTRFLSRDFLITAETSFQVSFHYTTPTPPEVICDSAVFSVAETTEPITADFTAVSRSSDADQLSIIGKNPYSVQFYDKSISGASNISKWEWDFGDGEKSDEKNPIHSFKREGVFSVSLKITDGSGNENTKTRNNFVTIYDELKPSFKYEEYTGIYLGDPNVILVDHKVEQENFVPDGKTWKTAFQCLSDAVEKASEIMNDYDHIEIWVAEGYYSPITGMTSIDIDFGGDLRIYGGFNSQSASFLDRDVKNNITLIDLSYGDHSLDYAFYASSSEIELTLDGIYFFGGISGTGTIISNGLDLTVSNCTFSYNFGTALGAGGAITTTSKTLVDSCKFNYNFGENGGSIYYKLGGSKLEDVSFKLIDNSEFLDNHTLYDEIVYVDKLVYTGFSITAFMTEDKYLGGYISVFEEESTPYAEEGEEEGEIDEILISEDPPIEISTLEDLQKIGDPAYEEDFPSGGNYILMDDIDASETELWDDGDGGAYEGFYPIPKNISDPNAAFSGVFDGDNHTITGLYISRLSKDTVGLFSRTSGVVKNLNIIDSDVRGKYYSGIISGINNGFIENCDVSGFVSGGSAAGGIVGSNISNSSFISDIGAVISKCSSNVSLGSSHMGGIAGWSGDFGTGKPVLIERCYSEVNPSGTLSILQSLGGITALAIPPLTIKNCYSNGTVSYENSDGHSPIIGGLVGSIAGSPTRVFTLKNSHSYLEIIDETSVGGEIEEDFNYVGGLIGSIISGSNFSIENSYYDSDVSNQDDIGKGDPKTTEEMFNRRTFIDWDSVTIWKIVNGDYPRLRFSLTEEDNDLDVLRPEGCTNCFSTNFGWDSPEEILNIPKFKVFRISEFIYDLISSGEYCYLFLDDSDLFYAVPWDLRSETSYSIGADGPNPKSTVFSSCNTPTVIEDSGFYKNTSSYVGSALSSIGDILVDNCKFAYNESLYGGVFSTYNFAESTISSTFKKSLLLGNKSSSNEIGGVVFIDENNEIMFENCVISENYSLSEDCSVINIASNSNTSFKHCSLVDNYIWLVDSDEKSYNNVAYTGAEESSVSFLNSIVFCGDWGGETVYSPVGGSNEFSETDSLLFPDPDDVKFNTQFSPQTFEIFDGNQKVDLLHRGYFVSEDIYVSNSFKYYVDRLVLKNDYFSDSDFLEVFRKNDYGSVLPSYLGSGERYFSIVDNVDQGVKVVLDEICLLPAPLLKNSSYTLEMASFNAYSFYKDDAIVILENVGDLDGSEGEFYENKGILFLPVIRITSLGNGDNLSEGYEENIVECNAAQEGEISDCFNSITGCGSISLGDNFDDNLSYYLEISIHPIIPITGFTLEINGDEEFTEDLIEGVEFTYKTILSSSDGSIELYITSDICNYEITEITNYQTYNSIESFNANNIYVLKNDIDFENSTSFSGPKELNGVFLGFGNTISNVTISEDQENVGLFSTIGSTGVVSDLNLSNITLTFGESTENVGLLSAVSNGYIFNSNVIGNSSIRRSSGVVPDPEELINLNIGGLIGNNVGNIKNSSVLSEEDSFVGEELYYDSEEVDNAFIFINENNDNIVYNIGGLVGENGSNGVIDKCFSEYVYIEVENSILGVVDGEIISTVGSFKNVGGVVGSMTGGSITDSYSRVHITNTYYLQGENMYFENEFSLLGFVNTTSPVGGFSGESLSGVIENCVSDSMVGNRFIEESE